MAFGIEFAPLFIPLHRRLQTLAVLYYLNEFILIGLITTTLLIYLLFTNYYFITLLYFIWFGYDYKTCFQGGRRTRWIREGRLWKYFADYFPIKLHKTAELPADKNYILCCHPHGIFSFSHFANFATDATNFSKLFPGIHSHLVTLNLHFLMPIHREIILGASICSSSAQSIEHILSKKNTGNAVSIIIGGAREVIDTIPGKMILTLKKRRGFCRIALKTGASLVPVISFGENDVYQTAFKEEMNLMQRIQQKLVTMMTFPIPIIFGRGIFQYSLGLLPFRKPINTIVGSPIDVCQNVNPTKADIDNLHQRYTKELIQLFEQNKNQFSNKNAEIKIK